MENEIPRINFKNNESLHVEVLNFKELLNKLEKADNHDPFSIHKIDFFLILIVTEGTYSHFVDFKTYLLEEGSALFVAKNQVHHFTRELELSEGFGIVFDHLFIDNKYFLSDHFKLNRLFNYHIETPIIRKKDMKGDSFLHVGTRMYQEYNFPNDFAKTEMMQAILYVLLLKAERAKVDKDLRGAKVQHLHIFNKFRELLENGYKESRNSRFYASELLVSYKLLNDIVKELSGKTVKTFIDDFVIIEVKRYLLSTPLSIKEICFKTGFEEPANLVNFFKKHENITPLKYRHQF